MFFCSASFCLMSDFDHAFYLYLGVYLNNNVELAVLLNMGFIVAVILIH